MSFRNYPHLKVFLPLLLCLGVLVGCQSTELPEATFSPLSVTAELDLDYALHGEVVFVKIFGDNTTGASVTVGGVPAQVTVLSGNTMEFPVPEGAPTGTQPVIIELDTRTLMYDIYVLGDDTVRREFMLVLEPGTTAAELAGVLEGLDYQLLEGPYSLGLDDGICSGERVHISISGMGTGAALTALAARSDGSAILRSDPTTGYSSGAVNPLSALGGHKSRSRNLTGTGTMVAVLDTGVSQHMELGDRLLLEDGYDFVDLGTLPLDGFAGGHGTPVAVLAAGSISGVAPGAQILPIRVCNDSGVCYSNDVLAGICHAMAIAVRNGPGMENLVLNLSFGGATPVPSIQEALQYALDRGVLVAVSGGNGASQGSKPHYPAALDLEGVVATAALDASLVDELLGTWAPASFSTRGDYIDISAPGVSLRSGNPAGSYGFGYTGTSYASAFTAGALAVWRQAHPELSPAQVEAALKAAAAPLPYPQDAVGAGMLNLSNEPN